MEQKKGALYKCKKPLKKNTTKKPLKKKTPRIKQLLIIIPLFRLGFLTTQVQGMGEWMRNDDIRRVDNTSMKTLLAAS
jgi:hypothetical protein